MAGNLRLGRALTIAAFAAALVPLVGVAPALAASPRHENQRGDRHQDDGRDDDRRRQVGITAGDVHSCALTSAGGVKCWGGNPWGALGDGTTTDRWTPVDVVGLGSGVRSVSAGWNFTCAVTAARGVKCWGYNLRGQLGDGTTTDRSTPVDVVGLTSGVQAVSAGIFSTCALTVAGAVKCWGLNHRGQLGDGTTTDRWIPVDVVGLTSGARSVSTGIWHSCAVTAARGAKCWGQNNFGQLGDGTTTDRATPVDVSGLTSGVAAIGAGSGNDGVTDGSHTCALLAAAPDSHRDRGSRDGPRAGAAKCWGINTSGQLGDGTTTDRPTPVGVVGLGSGVIALATGGGYTCGVTAGGAAKCWGINPFGQLGDGTTVNRPTPLGVVGLGAGVTDLAAGGYHGCVVTDRGGVKCWGGNGNGQVGNGTTVNWLTSVDVSGSFYRPECPTLLAARHTTFTMSDGYGLGSVATFTADSGYALSGSSTLRCRADRSWDRPVPSTVGTGSVTVTPNTGLTDGQIVTVALSGFAAFGRLGWCQAVPSTGPASPGLCGGPVHLGQADATGRLTDPAYPIARFVYVPALARWVDCADPAETCLMGAADGTDVPGSVAIAPLTFAP